MGGGVVGLLHDAHGEEVEVMSRGNDGKEGYGERDNVEEVCGRGSGGGNG